MTLMELLMDIMKEVNEHPDWKNMTVLFNTTDRQDLKLLSIYKDDGNKINIDIGTEDE